MPVLTLAAKAVRIMSRSVGAVDCRNGSTLQRLAYWHQCCQYFSLVWEVLAVVPEAMMRHADRQSLVK